MITQLLCNNYSHFCSTTARCLQPNPPLVCSCCLIATVNNCNAIIVIIHPIYEPRWKVKMCGRWSFRESWKLVPTTSANVSFNGGGEGAEIPLHFQIQPTSGDKIRPQLMGNFFCRIWKTKVLQTQPFCGLTECFDRLFLPKSKSGYLGIQFHTLLKILQPLYVSKGHYCCLHISCFSLN